MWGVLSRLPISCPAITTILCRLCYVPFPNKRVLFSCSSWHSHPDKGWVFSLTNSNGMHLVIPAHLSIFWMVCHPSRTFPLKKLEREPQNKLSHSPYCQTIPSLTTDPWPIALVLAGYKWVVLEPCVCSTFMWVHGLSAIHVFAIALGLVWPLLHVLLLILNLMWREWITRSSFFTPHFIL